MQTAQPGNKSEVLVAVHLQSAVLSVMWPRAIQNGKPGVDAQEFMERAEIKKQIICTFNISSLAITPLADKAL